MRIVDNLFGEIAGKFTPGICRQHQKELKPARPQSESFQWEEIVKALGAW